MMESACHSHGMLTKRLLRPINLQMAQFVDVLMLCANSVYVLLGPAEAYCEHVNESSGSMKC
jgi:hypothetical protein